MLGHWGLGERGYSEAVHLFDGLGGEGGVVVGDKPEALGLPGLVGHDPRADNRSESSELGD